MIQKTLELLLDFFHASTLDGAAPEGIAHLPLDRLKAGFSNQIENVLMCILPNPTDVMQIP